jgi:TRAP transporter TAXI family solute receptor
MPKVPVRKAVARTREIADRFSAPAESWRDLTARQWLEILSVVGPAVLLVVGAFWLAARFIEPAPPRRIAITTASQAGAYFANGQRYAAILKRSGITLDVATSAGSGENIKRLTDPASAFHVALIQGGTTNAEETPGLVSLGRMYLEPMWVFYRGSETISRLSQLRGKRVVVGPEGSGTRKLALELLKPNNVSGADTTLLPLAGAAAVEAILAGAVDAAFFTSAPNAPQIQTLIRAPGLRLMSFDQAEAYTRVFPYLSRIVLPKGAVDLLKNIPETDIEMVAPMAALVVRADLHPALVGLLVEAAKDVHSAGGMFNRIGEFPKAQDPEFPLSEDAERIYQYGPPFLQRYLPFWLATFIERMKVLVVPIATILLPMIKIVPALLRWRVRRRILHWYGQLKALEHRVAADGAAENIAAHRAEAERIELAVAAIPIPVAYHEEYYALRGAVDLVRNRLR